MIKVTSTTQEFNSLISKHFDARLVKANLASKNDIADFVKKLIVYHFDDKLKIFKKVTSNKTRHIKVKAKLDDTEKKLKQ